MRVGHTATQGGERAFGRPALDSRIAFALFFLSGAAALIDEISWSRQIGLLFGHTVHAAAIVLGSYFAGMAIGYAVGGRYASRFSPLRAYGVAELVVAAWVGLIPLILTFTEATSLLTWLVNSSPTTQTGLRAMYCFLLLLPATTALGATLPFMAEALAPSRGLFPQGEAAVGRVSWAYALNTAGAFAGAASATLFLLVNVGVRGSSYFAAGVSAFCGVAALMLARRASSCGVSPSLEESEFTRCPERSPVSLGSEDASQTPVASRFEWCWWSLIAGLGGFATLTLEVLYTRLFSLVFHNSTYTFGAVVALFLVSLALGAAMVPPLSRRVAHDTLLGVTAWLGAIATVVSVLVFLRMTGLEYFTAGESFAGYLRGGFALVAVVVVPPVTFAGMLLPLTWRSVRSSRGTGHLVGRLTMANTLAAAAGSVIASFVLLPTVGLWGSFGVAAAVFLVISAAILIRSRRIGLALLGGLTGIPLIVLLGIGSASWTRPPSLADEELVRRWESAYGWIDVVRSRDSGAWKLRQNLHYRHGATGTGAVRERRLAHIPLLLHEQPREVLFLGLGTGVTASGALPFDEIERIDIVELIPDVVEAARLLSEFNGDIVDQPRVTIRVDDARHDLLANEHRYDVIVSDLFVPWESHTGYLYTVEQYRAVRSRLKPGGLFCQWLPLYQLGAREFELIADSCSAVFPETALWWGDLDARSSVLALVGSEEPINIDPDRLCDRFEALHRSHRSPVPDPYLTRAEHLCELSLGEWPRRKSSLLNTDEHPRVEFLTPRSHRNENLLAGSILQRYFDTVLANLPGASAVPGCLQDGPRDSTTYRRARQHLILFGE